MKFYRYTFSPVGEYWESVRIKLNEYPMVKETPKGYWIKLTWKKNKWIPKESKKRFAYPTKKEAMVNFIKRTERHKAILEGRAKVAGMALSDAEALFNRMDKELI